MIQQGKCAVVAMSLPISASLTRAWNHGRAADDWPTLNGFVSYGFNNFSKVLSNGGDQNSF